MVRFFKGSAYSGHAPQALAGPRSRLAASFDVMTTLNFTDDELLDAAQAARAASALAEKDAEKQSSPKVKGLFENTARRFRELAEKFERARRMRA